jgi:DNA repair exonuclease SbcCD ATPase subunit
MSFQYFDEVCNKNFSTQSALNKHLKSPSHLKQMKLNELKTNVEEVDEEKLKKMVKKQTMKLLYCPLCDFTTKNKEDFTNHIISRKHSENLALFKFENRKTPEEYEKLKEDLSEYIVNIGIVKGKEITKEDINQKYNVDVSKMLKWKKYTKKEDRVEDSEEEKERKKKIEKLETEIKIIEYNKKKYEKDLKKYEKFLENVNENEAQLNPDLLPKNKKLKEDIKKLDGLKKQLENLM